MNDEEYNELLIGMEKAGWPCRLVELPDYYISLAKEVDQLRAEVARLREYIYKGVPKILCIRCSYGVREQGESPAPDCRECAKDRARERDRLDRVLDEEGEPQ